MEDHLLRSPGSLYQNMVQMSTIHGNNLAGLCPNSEYPSTDPTDPFRHGFVPTTQANNGNMEGHHSVYDHMPSSGTYQPVQQLDMAVPVQMPQYDVTRSRHVLQQFPFPAQLPSTNDSGLIRNQGSSNRDQNRHQRLDSFRCGWSGCHYDRPFRRKVDLMRHIEGQHVSPSSYRCAWCQRTFNRRDNLGEHRRRVHGVFGL
ncbi:hypothetical protein BO94DRAFT_130073 [Aspergillus sclerotioniger CBS 115572]|uniref:C2H2-type domain-containing protein n=1 Tax=Aspergillus sclerotioniger CBS 115572 TaxID=1450535 RepID=A0A317XD92_9EURO|nr:hypothetical protein BO94DRAFT_130073 [Aspergillus sclerotioniger CBS 115572]PWY95567.1 hypothetical protein BO94DRAFT_130073 [Aspergillus sclerotioniger CBS 115572]